MQVRTIGFITIAVGILMIAYTGFNYVTTEKIVDLGTIEIEQEKNHPVQWSPYVGIALLIGGIAMVLLSKKQIS
jgi:uncharacterized membrane protein YidH (DUF202 family)